MGNRISPSWRQKQRSYGKAEMNPSLRVGREFVRAIDRAERKRSIGLNHDRDQALDDAPRLPYRTAKSNGKALIRGAPPQLPFIVERADHLRIE